MRIRLDIAYDGTHFRGWAKQPGLRTVQGTLEAALGRIVGPSTDSGPDPQLVVAGRTDAGVHAIGQVAHIDLDERQWSRLLNRRGRGAADPSRADPSRADASRADASRADASRADPSRADPSRADASRADPSGMDPVLGDAAPAADPAPGAPAHEDPSPDAAPAADPSPAETAPAETALAAASLAAASHAAASLAGRIRGVLGQYPDVTVARTSLAPEGFDARFSAVWRRYRYRLSDARSGYDPLLRHDTTAIRGTLDEAAMDAAARTLIGLHDFAAYCKAREEATTIRTLLDYRWTRDASGVLIAEVKADAFCHSMVRALVGACAAVGQGRLRVEDLARLRDELTRTSAFTVLAARGLTLTEVGYPADELLAARAEQTRNRRDRDG